MMQLCISDLLVASFASFNITRIVNTDLSMPTGQLYLNTFGEEGMLAVSLQVGSIY